MFGHVYITQCKANLRLGMMRECWFLAGVLFYIYKINNACSNYSISRKVVCENRKRNRVLLVMTLQNSTNWLLLFASSYILLYGRQLN